MPPPNQPLPPVEPSRSDLASSPVSYPSPPPPISLTHPATTPAETAVRSNPHQSEGSNIDNGDAASTTTTIRPSFHSSDLPNDDAAAAQNNPTPSSEAAPRPFRDEVADVAGDALNAANAMVVNWLPVATQTGDAEALEVFWGMEQGVTRFADLMLGLGGRLEGR